MGSEVFLFLPRLLGLEALLDVGVDAAEVDALPLGVVEFEFGIVDWKEGVSS